MIKSKVKIPFFCNGDIGALAYTITNNIVNYASIGINLN